MRRSRGRGDAAAGGFDGSAPAAARAHLDTCACPSHALRSYGGRRCFMPIKLGSRPAAITEMAAPKRKKRKVTDAIRQVALAFPDVEEGLSCKGTAVERS